LDPTQTKREKTCNTSSFLRDSPPNAAIATEFETINVLTVDGQVINGLQISASNPVVLKDASGKIHSLPQEDIAQLKSG
jgi:hypothetical protein